MSALEIDVERTGAPMALMRLKNPDDHATMRPAPKPPRHGVAQNADTGLEPWDVIDFAPPPFSSDHQNAAMAASMGFSHETVEGAMRAIRGHAMQIEPRIRLSATFAKPVGRATVEICLRPANRSRSSVTGNETDGTGGHRR
ncbi:MAG: hypothetical protein AAFR84_06765 [Pseudomonadota bacterium]